MTFSAGDRLGPYEVTGLLGAGGMGVVFRARDTRLKRDVALKVLPASVSTDAERIARFQREAELLASLSHPNIAAVFGVEDAAGTRALVMELVDGETLATRIGRGPLALGETLDLARQLAEALDYAHEHGVLHRDLKPDNIKISEDGRLTVLDFGLAKALDPPAGVMPSPENSPTLTSPAFTQAGTLLGTAAYMSPEQARGRAADRRADIWAFGCILFEMLTQRRPFEGETVADALAAIMMREPDWTLLPPGTPVAAQELIQRCLQKDPRRRLRDIGDAYLALDLAAAPLAVGQAPRSDPTAGAQNSKKEKPVRYNTERPRGLAIRFGPWIPLLVGVGLLTFGWRGGRRAEPPRSPVQLPLVQVESKVGSEVSLVTDQGPAAVLSPDGTMMAFVARTPEQPRRLFIRRLDRLTSTMLAGTEDARIPFFSPDGRWVGFFASGKLKRVPVDGGPVVVVCDAGTGRGASWGDDDAIVFNSSAGPTPLSRVSAAGGEATTFLDLLPGEASQRWPQVLPGARALIYSASSNLGNWNDGTVVLQPLPSGERRVLVKGGFFGRYIRSGHLTYVHDGRLLAIPFDLDRMETHGTAVPVLQSVARSTSFGAAQIDIATSGTAVYINRDAAQPRPLQWLTRDGRVTTLPFAESDWSNPRLSPDGQRLAVDVSDGGQADIWIHDLTRASSSRLTFDAAEDWMPLWTPDGERVVFRSARGQFAFNLYWQKADGAGVATAVTQSRDALTPTTWHPDGEQLAYVDNNPATNYDVMLMALSQKNGTPGPSTPILNSPAQEFSASFSPDGRWLAYVSNESGRPAVYVRSYPGPGGQWMIAPEGSDPVWSRAKKELLYLSADQRLMAVSYAIEGNSFRPEPPRPWGDARAAVRSRGFVGFDGRAFDLHPDGERVIGAWRPTAEPVPMQDTVILAFNLFDELQRLTASGAR